MYANISVDIAVLSNMNKINIWGKIRLPLSSSYFVLSVIFERGSRENFLSLGLLLTGTECRKDTAR
jgi:hypothetical protein